MESSVSVLMSAYNAEKTIKYSINSVLSQTFTNWEFVIVDDCSTDNTNLILDSYAKKYPEKFTIIRNQLNLGLPASLNIGADYCKGEYIARIDADDICLPERLQKQQSFLTNYKKYALVSSSVYFIDEKGTIIGRTYPPYSHRSINNALKRKNIIYHSSVMFRKSSFYDCDKYCEALRTWQDWHLWVKFLKKGYNLYTLIEPTIFYRITSNSLTSSTSISHVDYRKKSNMIQTKYHITNDMLDKISRENNLIHNKTVRIKQTCNTIHCKTWYISKKLFLPEKFVNAVVCFFHNIKWFFFI